LHLGDGESGNGMHVPCFLDAINRRSDS
jgi:hypothetical protein